MSPYHHARHRSHCEETWAPNQFVICPLTGHHHSCHRRKAHPGHCICYCQDINRHPNMARRRTLDE
jgi:hypothetical protein